MPTPTPAKPPHDLKRMTTQILCNASEAEKDNWRQAAKLEGMPFSRWITQKLNEGAKRTEWNPTS